MANFCNIWSPIISGKTSASSQDMYTHRCWGFHVLESIQSWYSTLNMRCVYVLGYGHTHACICSSVDLTCLRFASVCLQFRFFFFLISSWWLMMLMNWFDERRWITPEQHWFSLALTMSVMDLGNSSCQISCYVPFIAYNPLTQFMVHMKLCEYFTNHNHPTRKDIRTASNQRSCLKQWKITVSNTVLYHDKFYLAMV